MGKILFTAAVGDIRGSIGAVSFEGGRYHSLATKKPTARRQSSAEQRLVRGNLAGFTRRWSQVLNQGQRDDWNALALTKDFHDVFDQVYHITGLSLYLLCNQNLKTIGKGPIDDIPPALTCGSPGSATLVIAGSPPTLVANSSNAPAASEHCVILASRGLSPGVLVVGKWMVKLQHFPAGIAGPWDLTDKWVAKNGDTISGQRIFVEVRFYDEDNGWQGTPAQAYDDVP
jgi:hypothetical protein